MKGGDLACEQIIIQLFFALPTWVELYIIKQNGKKKYLEDAFLNFSSETNLDVNYYSFYKLLFCSFI